MNLYLRTDWGVIDILSDVLGVGDFARLKARAETFTLGGKSCPRRRACIRATPVG
jgi:hypothetical protein